MSRKPPAFIIAIDTREQRGYLFKNAIVKTLRTGDYSVVGHEETGISIERKSRADAFNSLGQGRARFQREFARLAKYDRAYVVIEASLDDMLKQPPYTKMNPKAVVNSLIAWSVRYGVHIIFAGSRRNGQAITYRILEKFAKDRQEKDSGGRVGPDTKR